MKYIKMTFEEIIKLLDGETSSFYELFEQELERLGIINKATKRQRKNGTFIIALDSSLLRSYGYRISNDIKNKNLFNYENGKAVIKNQLEMSFRGFYHGQFKIAKRSFKYKNHPDSGSVYKNKTLQSLNERLVQFRTQVYSKINFYSSGNNCLELTEELKSIAEDYALEILRIYKNANERIIKLKNKI